MTQQAVTEIQNAEVLATPQEIKRKKATKRRRKKIVKNIIVLIIIAAVIVAGYFGFKKLFNKEENVSVLTDFSRRGTITTQVSGGGVTTPLVSEPVKAEFKCKIDTVIALPGTNVNVGDALYSINTEEVQKELTAAEKLLTTYKKEYDAALKAPQTINEQIAALEKKIAALSVYAPFSGKVMAVTVAEGKTISEGASICKLVDDSQMLLTLYFSYAYINDIKAGQTASISIPSTMSNISGKVKEIAKVERISAEGTKLFEVTFVMDNPGTLSEDVAASASITLASGETVTPYEAGKLKFYEVKEIISIAGGELKTNNLRDFAVVKKGDKLISLTNDAYSKQIKDLYDSVNSSGDTTAACLDKLDKQKETIAQLQAKIENNVIYSKVNGMVTSVVILAGQAVEKDTQVMTVSDSSVMTIAARIDSLNISDVKVGTEVTITQNGMDSNTTFTGVIADVSLEGKYENNYSYFPATIRVENADGAILSGTYVQYTIVANQAVDCIMVPTQCIKYTDAGTVLLIKAESKPENALDIDAIEIPEGFYAVPVVIGLSDNYNVEIKEGVDEGVELFMQTMTDSGSSWNNGGNMGGGSVMVG